MSIQAFYLKKGFPLQSRSVVLSGAGTHSVWIPRSGYRAVVTNLTITTVDVAGTIAFYFDNGNSKIAQYALGASAYLSPVIGGWESTVTSGRIFAVKNAIQTDGISINLDGFEIPTSGN